jgi:hypothetical protein
LVGLFDWFFGLGEQKSYFKIRKALALFLTLAKHIRILASQRGSAWGRRLFCGVLLYPFSKAPRFQGGRGVDARAPPNNNTSVPVISQ